MKRWPVVCLFAWAVASAAASDVSLSELAPPGFQLVAGVNVRGLLDSSLAKEIGAQERDLGAKLAAKGNLTGFDPFKDLDRAWIFMMSADDKSPALVVARGRFEVERLAHGARRYKDVPVIGDGAGGNGVIGLLNAETAVIGKKDQVEAAIGRLGSGAQLDAEMKARIDAAGTRYEVWGMGEIAGGGTRNGLAIGAAGSAPSSIDRFMFGVALRQGLVLTAEIHARSTEDAAKMMALIGVIGAAVKAQKKGSGITLDVQSENGTFQISLTVPESELHQAIHQRQTALVESLSKRLGGRAAPAAPQPDTRPQIVKAPNGDTMVLRLPGAR